MNSHSHSHSVAEAHDHDACIADALSAAEAYCKSHGLRLTELRRRVLELVWASHRPVGAYTVLERLAEEGRKAAPPTVYRSLEFLLEHGLVHRIESLNAYMGCNHPGTSHDAQFFICTRCGNALEMHDTGIQRVISEDAARLGFRPAAQTVEITGLCASCDKEASS